MTWLKPLVNRHKQQLTAMCGNFQQLMYLVESLLLNLTQSRQSDQLIEQSIRHVSQNKLTFGIPYYCVKKKSALYNSNKFMIIISIGHLWRLVLPAVATSDTSQ